METKLYQEFATIVDARKRCQQRNNQEWFNKHTETINKLIVHLPHGSGLDGEWCIDYENSHANKLIFYMEYHAMDDYGYYDSWIDFTLIITPSLISGLDLHIRGKFGKYSNVKDYLYDILHYALDQTMDTNKL